MTVKELATGLFGALSRTGREFVNVRPSTWIFTVLASVYFYRIFKDFFVT
jgi:hypothetical protein